jgi:hypothetical protein
MFSSPTPLPPKIDPFPLTPAQKKIGPFQPTLAENPTPYLNPNRKNEKSGLIDSALDPLNGS